MAALDFKLTPWQQEVIQSPSRFKVVTAGRRCGKSYMAAVSLIVSALNGKPGGTFYVAPTQGLARDVMWGMLFELAHEIIEASNINNLEITLSGGNKISLKGADRPDSLRGISLKHLVLDEYAYMKPDVWEAILRPALSDRKGSAIFISTPAGRNHMYDLYINASLGKWKDWSGWQFTTYDNPFMDPDEIEHAKETLPRWAFNQEYMASYDAQGSEYFNAEDFLYYDALPKGKLGSYYIAVDLAGFESDRGNKTKHRDNSAFAVVLVDDNGTWYVEDIQFGRWSLDETAEKIFNAVAKYRPLSVGIEKGIAQQAVMGPLSDLMRRTNRVFRVELLSHGNSKKQDRILWALQGRIENKKIRLKHADWNTAFVDEAASFPSQLTHDDLLDALSYIDQLAVVPYMQDLDVEDDYEPFDSISGY